MAIDFDLSLVLASIVLLLPVLWYFRRKKGYSSVQMIFLGVFLAYLVGVVSKTLFPIYLDSSMREAIGQNVWDQVNLIPLVELVRADIKTSFLNVLLLIPFGFFISFFLQRRGWARIAVYGLVLSAVIELLQFVTAFAAGFTMRFVDVNDVIFNVLGAIFGYGAFCAFATLFQTVLRAGTFEMNPVLEYLAAATKRRVQ